MRLQPYCLQKGDHHTKRSIQNEKAENYDPDKGTKKQTNKKKKKQTKKQLSNHEISNLHEKHFRLTIVKMIKDFGNKLEAKIDKLQETMNKEIKDLKIKQADI